MKKQYIIRKRSKQKAGENWGRKPGRKFQEENFREKISGRELQRG